MIGNKIIQIIVADSQFLVVEALRSLFRKEEKYIITGTVSTKDDLYKLLEKENCDLLITDFATIDYDGIDDLKNISQIRPQISVLVLTNTISKQEFNSLSKIGIRNIIYKTADKDEIFSAIESTLKGRKFYSDEILDLFIDQSINKYIVEDPKHLTVSEI